MQKFEVRIHRKHEGSTWRTYGADSPLEAAQKAFESLMLAPGYEVVIEVETPEGKRFASRMFHFRAVVTPELVDEMVTRESD